MRTMYDSVTAADIPQAAQMVGGYVDGLYRWSDQDWQRFPNATKVRISVDPSNDDGHVQDVEQGNGTPAQAVEWVKLRRASGADPSVYCSASTWPQVRAAFQQAGVPEPHYWIAQWDGSQNVPLGAVAKQYADPQTSGGHYDLSAVPGTWPGVDTTQPQPQPQPAPSPHPEPGKYTVVPGDTLSAIAARHGMTWQQLLAFGGNRQLIHDPNLIYPGQVLDVPTGQPQPRRSYTVREGDTLSEIATDPAKLGDEYHGNWNQLYMNNRDVIGGNPNLIYPGQVLH